MKRVFQSIIDSVEALPDRTYGNRYRCACTLSDGTQLPCVVLQSRSKLVALAKKRIEEERLGIGALGGKDPFGQIVSSFATGGNRVANYDVVAAEKSRFAIPELLLSKIVGETWMSWTGWVFEMKDGHLFSYGSSFSFEFFQLPEGYGFDDVQMVHNHSYVDASGNVRSLKNGIPDDYDRAAVLRERIYFDCYIEGL